MDTTAIPVFRDSAVLRPDQTRVLMRPFSPGDSPRMAGIAQRVMRLSEDEAGSLLAAISDEFSQRHQDVRRRFLERFDQIRLLLTAQEDLSEQRRMLIGSYFLSEYSLESAALFNPSMVPHPNQADVPKGSLRFILSLRAVGEGHFSSITFRSGLLQRDHRVKVLPSVPYLTGPQQIPAPVADEPARSNYEVQFAPELALSQRILFPGILSPRNGIEGARFVRFANQDGSFIYYATFTAYDGSTITPELVETADFLRFRFSRLNGAAARNKGMALFPRKIGGRYAMLSRQDENIHITFSSDVYRWETSRCILRPEFPWEMVQIGNCGSPIETDAGWLVLSHGVGPFREYSIGAFLLDRDDPAKVLGRLRQPLIRPNTREREGYVPNVVYSCGGLVHAGRLVIPYGLAGHATGFATAALPDVLDGMETSL